MFFWICKKLTGLMMKICLSVRYEGLQNIPQGKGLILASNHRSNWDPVIVAQKLKAQLYFMAKVELFQIPVFGRILKWLGAFPVQRGKGDSGAIDWAVNIVENNKILAMFPEGTRSKDGKPGRARSGVALIAGQTKADILPCAVSYSGKLSFRKRIVVRYGKLIPFTELGMENSGSPSELKKASQLIMGRITELLDA